MGDSLTPAAAGKDGDGRKDTRPWMRALAWALLLGALHQVFVWLSVTLAQRDVDLWFFFSSDTVQYGLLYKDLAELGFHYAGWNISHAPEYVQMAWSLLLRALTPTLATGHVLEALTQPLLLAFALNRLLSRGLGRATAVAPLVVTAFLLMIARGAGLDFIGFIWSNRHGFTALIGVLALSFCFERRETSWRSLLPLGLLTALGVASDLLFVVWFVAPALAAFALGYGATRRSWAVRVCGSVLVGAVLGLLLFWFATPLITVGDKVGVDLSRATGALGRMADDASAEPHRFLSLLLAAGAAIAVLAVWRGRRLELRILGIFSLCLTASTIAAMALTSAPFREAGYTRYLLAPELAALVAVALALPGASARMGERVLLAGIAAGFISGYQVLPADVPPVSRYDPPLSRCVDAVARKHGLQYGVADYWLAKYLTAFSSEDLSIVAVTPRLDPFVSFSNIEWFLGGVGARRHDRPVYTFAIQGSRTPEEQGVSSQALAALGPSIAVESCFGFPIHILPAGSSERIRAQFAENPRIRAYYASRGLKIPEP